MTSKEIDHKGERMTEQEVAQYAEENTVDAVEGERCVDGRYPEKYFGKLALAGAALGRAMALLKLNYEKGLGLSIRRILQLTIAATDGPVEFHTDHSEHEGATIGCGHAMKAIMDALAYGLKEGDVTWLVENIQPIANELGRPVDKVELPGKHAELGVLVVTGTARTVNPNGLNKGEHQMFFVYDAARAKLLFEEFTARVKKIEPKLKFSADELYKAFYAQTMETLHQLAPGKPIYELNVDGKLPRVKYVGDVKK